MLTEAEQGTAVAVVPSLHSCAVIMKPQLDFAHPEHRQTFLYLLHLTSEPAEQR
jgi:hypothetical protein